MYSARKWLITRLLMTSLFVTMVALIVVGQLAAQDIHSVDAELICLNTLINPDNTGPEAIVGLTPDYLVMMRHDGQDFEIVVQNRITGVATQITNNAYEDYYPKMDGQYVVWQFESPANTTWDIALYNVTTGITQIISDSSKQDTDAHIEGDYIAWGRNEGSSSVVYYNIATGVTEAIAVKHLNGHHFSVTGIDGGKVLYYHVGPSDSVDLNVHDLQTDQKTVVDAELPETDRKYNSQIHGDIVVWQNEVWGGGAVSSEIYAFHLGTQTLTQITDNSLPDEWPSLYGDYIAYRRTTLDGSEIHLYDLQNGTTNVIAESTTVEYAGPVVNGTRVAWQSTDGVYVYDIPTSTLTHASENAGDSGVIVEDNLVFWNEMPNEDTIDIYMAACGFAPQIVQDPQDVVINSGETAMLSVVATGDATLTYQWYEGDATDSSVPVPGANAAMFVTPPLTETIRFWVRVTNNYGGVESLRAEVVVDGVASTATPEATLTPTPTVPGSVQLLPNADFETDVDSDKIPDGWSAKNTTLDKSDKLKRNKLDEEGNVKTVAYSGEAAFMFRGNPDGQKSKLQYKLNDFGAVTDGTRLEFSVFVNRFNVTPGTTIGKVKITFDNGTTDTLQLAMPSEQGYTSVSDMLVVDLDGRTIDKFKVEFSTKLTGGKFLIDRTSLLVIPSDIVVSSDLLPLP